MTADLTIQYAVTLGDDEGDKLTLVADSPTELAQHVHNTLTGWPGVKEWGEQRAITENGAMRFEAHLHGKWPVLEAWVRGFVRCNDGTPDAGIPDLDDGFLSIIPMTSAWRDLQDEWGRDAKWEGLVEAYGETTASRIMREAV